MCDGCSGGYTQQGVEAGPECMRGCALCLDVCPVTRDTRPQHSPARPQPQACPASGSAGEECGISGSGLDSGDQDQLSQVGVGGGP